MPKSANGHPQWALIAALLAATFFRARPLLENRFHPDEALYAWFARLIGAGHDVLLAGPLVDKPPLAFYLGGLGMALIGGHEFAARLPAFFASLISVALIFQLGKKLYDARTGLLAAGLLALSPFAILFAITVFIDPLVTAFSLWGLWMTRVKSPRWAAVAFSLAFAAKQSALFFLPLALAFVFLTLPARAGLNDALKTVWRHARFWLAGLILTTLLLLAWDAARQPLISFWDQGYSDNAPNRLIRANEVLPRANAWLELLSYATASALLNALFVIGLPVLLIRQAHRPARAALVDFLLASYLLVYLAAYWLLAFNVWDRYLVQIVPLILLLLARVLWRIADSLWRIANSLWPQLSRRNYPLSAIGYLLPLVFCFILLPSSLTAAQSGYPIGGDHGAYDGIDDAARFLNALPYGTVLYDHWLSWLWNFYLFDGPVYVSWFPTPDALTTDLQAFGRASPRYIAIPSWEADIEIRAAAARAGFHFVAAHTAFRRDGSVSLRVYQIVPDAP